MQRSAAGPAPGRASLATPGPGRPLDASTRGWFEPRLGADLGGVRIHTGGRADEAARSVAARAFTLGADITFAAGQFAPDRRHGRRLLAHELVHVVQQGAPGSTAGKAVNRQPTDEARSARVDPSLLGDLDAAVDEAASGAHQDADLMLRARASRMHLLLTWTGRPGLNTRAELDAFLADCTERASTELGSLQRFTPAGVELALLGYPKGFPLTWSGRVQAALTLGVDQLAVIKAWAAEKDALTTESGLLGPLIFDKGLPVPLADAVRLTGFRLRVADAKAAGTSPVGDFASHAVLYMQTTWLSAFAVAWERGVELVAGAVADGTQVASYADWKNFVDTKQAILRDLPLRATTVLAKDDAEATAFASSSLALADAALAVGLVGGLAALIGILDGWGTGADLFAGSLRAADALVAGDGGFDRVYRSLTWAYANGYFVAAFDAQVADLVANGPETVGKAVAIAIGLRIPYVQIPLAIYLIYTTARDAIEMLDATASALNAASQAPDVGRLQAAGIAEAQVLSSIALQILVVLITEGVTRSIGKISGRIAELRKATPGLTEEQAAEQAMKELSAKEREPLERGAGKVAKKFADFADACVLGSIRCRARLPAKVLNEAGDYPTAHDVPMPKGGFVIQKAILQKVPRGTERLRDICRGQQGLWPEFDKALAKARKAGKDWPLDANGEPWEPHHVKPVFMGGDNAPENLCPLPRALHQQYSSWWNRVHAAFRKRFSDTEWDDIYWSEKDVPGSKVPQNRVR